MHEIFSKLQFHTCKLQFWHRLSLFIIDSLKIVSPKLIVTLSFCLFAEDQSRNLHHKFFKFQNKQARNLVKKKQTTRQEIWADFEKATSKCPKRTQRRERGRPRQSRIKVRESQKLLFLPLHNFSNKRSKKFAYLILQVNLCQKLLFLHQLTHNMMTDCSLNWKFNKWKFQAQTTWGEHVVYRNCFWHSEQSLYTTCSPYVLQKEELLTKIYL